MDFRDEKERLVAEQAVLAHRAVCEAAEQAAYGHGMEAMEDAVLSGGRQLQRRMLEEATKSRLESEKGGRVARSAARTARISAPRLER